MVKPGNEYTRVRVTAKNVNRARDVVLPKCSVEMNPFHRLRCFAIEVRDRVEPVPPDAFFDFSAAFLEPVAAGLE